MTAVAAGTTHADKLEMQHRLFAELSAMFGREVPLYDKSLLVNKACNRAVCALLSRLHPGFAISESELDRTSGERHGAIRIGRADEFRWVGRLFACFAMEPHNFYDMTTVGARSQPVIATAFRSVSMPEHRVFTSLLMTDYFDPATRARIEALLEGATAFSDRARRLIERSERDGGLDWHDADALIEECTARIFKWTGRARDHGLYGDLCGAGFKIAADIACFESHHLNHLTPNTLCMDLYTAAMKHCLGEVDAAWFERRAATVLERLAGRADRDFMRLHFRHLDAAQVAAFGAGAVGRNDVAGIVADLAAVLAGPEFALSRMNHSGFKDFTEGPSEDTPVLLRQDAYRALTEPVQFAERDGTIVPGSHTARFGEIEERFYACTAKGRRLYDECLAAAELAREQCASSPKNGTVSDIERLEAAYAAPFAAFPKSLSALVAAGLVHARYRATAKGIAAAAAGAITTCDLAGLVREGFADLEGLRYEDFLPVSAAGIFASNLQRGGTRSTAAVKPSYSQRQLEEILGRGIIDATAMYAVFEARSKLETYARLGLLERVPEAERSALEACVRSR